jgi:hypothetical protein
MHSRSSSFRSMKYIPESPVHTIISKHPASRSKGVFSDFRYFFLEKPAIETLVRFDTEEERQKYEQSILQRTGLGVNQYRMLNIHRIGIEAPTSYLFEELLHWNGDSSCWPNHIAKVTLLDDDLNKIRVSLFGLSRHILGLKKGLFGLHFLQLFNLESIRIQRIPDPADHDNARYLLYKCSGGYPIGIFSMYVRSSIPERGETEMSQLFILVGFNFYGKESLSKLVFLNKLWEGIHNRVTTNIANRFKQLCEWQFEKIQNP